MKKSKIECDLQSCFLCKLCTKEWIPAISTHRKNFQYKKGETLFQEGDKVTGIFFMYDGKVKVHKKWGHDKELIVRFAHKGDIVGHRGLGKDAVYPITATVLEPATVCFIDLDFFQASLKVNYDFIYQLMIFYARELQESEKNMRNLAHMTVKGRLAIALLMLKEKFGVTEEGAVNIDLSRQDLASYSGTTYETVFRLLGEFVQDETISLSGKNIILLNPERLHAYINEAEF